METLNVTIFLQLTCFTFLNILTSVITWSTLSTSKRIFCVTFIAYRSQEFCKTRQHMLQIKSFHTLLSFPLFLCLWVLGDGSRNKLKVVVVVVVAAATTPFRAQQQRTHTTVTLFGNHLIHDITIKCHSRKLQLANRNICS